MIEKLVALKTKLEQHMEKLTEIYGDGLVNGFSPELLIYKCYLL